MSCNKGIFSGDWIWIIIAVIVFICLCNDNNGIFGRDCC